MSYEPAIYDSFATLMICVEAHIDEVPPEQIASLYQKVDLTSENPSVMMQICKLAPLMILEIATDSEKCDEFSLCYDVMYFFRVLEKDQDVSHLSDRDQARFNEIEARFEESPFVKTKLEYHVRYQYDKSKVPHFLVQQIEERVGKKLLDALIANPNANLRPLEQELNITLTSVKSPGRIRNETTPTDPDVEPRAMYTHPAVIQQLAPMIQSPGAFKGLLNAQMTLRDDGDQRHIEPERPPLLTENPPQGAIEASKRYETEAYILAFLCFPVFIVLEAIAFITTWGGISPIWFSVVAVASTGLIAVKSHEAFVKSHDTAMKWNTSYHTIVYDPPLKSGKSAVVEIQLELPVGWSTQETISRLENCAKPSLYELFADADTVPLRSKVRDCIERQLALKQRELDLALCRMEMLKCFDPAMPAFGSRHVFSSNHIIVTYEIADLWRTDAVNAKLGELLRANLATDLTRHAKTLNIRFIDIEKQPEKIQQKGFAFNG
jgi:hypothetical protein